MQGIFDKVSRMFVSIIFRLRIAVSRVFFSLNILIVLGLLLGCVQQPLSINSVKVAQTRVELGFEYLSIDEFELAQSNFERALQFDKQNVHAILGLAIIAQSSDQFDVAKNYYQQALQIAPDDVFLLNNYGAFSCHLGQYMQAKSIFENAQSTDKNFEFDNHPALIGCDIDDLSNTLKDSEIM